MPEKTKRKKDFENAAKNPSAENEATDSKDNWSEDQKTKSYYYDDSYGYEIYNPSEDDENGEDASD